jgi:D-alanyl-D-alanine carboxypeptidase/D-alanyl-D-alanine-endopeptidase (penicillin-binding protein 4)
MTLIALLLLTNCSSTKNINSQHSKITPLSVPAQIKELINATDPNLNVGIKIVSLHDNRVLYEQNSHRHFIPGSTIKLVTIAAALYYLGPNYRFTTNILTDNINHKTGEIKNIYLKGSGDPSLMEHDLANLARELKQQKITHITGDIFIDSSIFDDVLLTRGAMWDDRKHGYAAPVSGINLNYNRIVIKTIPAHQPHFLAHAIARPATNFIKVISRAETKNEKITNNLKVSVKRNKDEKPWAEVTDSLDAGDHVYINGEISKNSSPSYSLLAIKDPALLAATILKEQLLLLGIKFTGKITQKSTPEQALVLASHQSRALSEALIDWTKISNNVAIDSIVKTIAANAQEKPATFAGGLKLINDFLTHEVKIAAGSLINADGSGVSRYNLMTPDHMVKILTYAANRFNMGPEFMAAMPLAGEGTLSSRTKAGLGLEGNLRAKTGSLSGINALAGYFMGDHGKRFAFAIMMNGFVGQTAKYTELQNKILSTLLPAPESQVASSK